MTCTDIEKMYDSSNSESKNVNKPISKETFMEDTQFFLSQVMRREAKIGLHTWRNTLYLLAILGEGDQDEIRKSARHKTYQSIYRYEKDNATLLEMIQYSKDHDELMLLIPK